MNSKINKNKEKLLATKIDKLPLSDKVIRSLYFPYLGSNGRLHPHKKHMSVSEKTLERDIPTLAEFFEMNSSIVPNKNLGVILKRRSTERSLKADSEAFKALLEMLVEKGFTPADSPLMLAAGKYFRNWKSFSPDQLKKMSLAQVCGLKTATLTFSIIGAYILNEERTRNIGWGDYTEKMLSIPVSAVLSWDRDTFQGIFDRYKLSSDEERNVITSMMIVQTRLRELGLTPADGTLLACPVPKKSYTYSPRDKALLKVFDALLPIAKDKVSETDYSILELILSYGYTYAEAGKFLNMTEANIRSSFDAAVMKLVSETDTVVSAKKM